MSSFKKVWRTPLLLGISILFGLLAALLGTGGWYWAAWAAMIVPLALLTRKVVKSTHKNNKI
jgi:hypothetical protein